MRCWPTGRPMDWVGWSRVKVKMRVSCETECLAVRAAGDQVLGWRKTGRGVVGAPVGVGLERAARAEGERCPMWWVGIMALALSLSGEG